MDTPSTSTGGRTILFEDYLAAYIDDLADGRRTKRGCASCVSPSYIRALRTVLTQIRRYQSAVSRKLSLDDITMQTRNSLMAFWRGNGLMPNAMNSYMANIRTVAQSAYEEKLTARDEFSRRDFVPRKEAVESVYLTSDQIRDMLEMELSSKEAVLSRLSGLDIPEAERQAAVARLHPQHLRTLERGRDIFAVGCLTGQRVSDYSRICEDMICRLGGAEFIVLTQRKTGKKVYVPLDGRVKQVLAKHGGRLPQIQPNLLNRAVKEVGLLMGWTWDCGFDDKGLNPKRGRRFCDMLMSHTARRSFATNAYKAGIPLSSIQVVTGHGSEAQLRRYLRLDAEEKALLAFRDFQRLLAP